MIQQRVTIGDGGRFVLPAAFRKEMGVGIGDELIIRVEDGEMRAFTQRQALEKLRKLVKNDKTFSVDDFLKFRKMDSRDHE